MAACSLSGFIRGKTLDVIPTLINGHDIYIYIYAYIYIYDSLWLVACWNNAGFNPKNTDYVTVSWCGVIPSLAKALWAAKSFNDPRLVENKGFHQWKSPHQKVLLDLSKAMSFFQTFLMALYRQNFLCIHSFPGTLSVSGAQGRFFSYWVYTVFQLGLNDWFLFFLACSSWCSTRNRKSNLNCLAWYRTINKTWVCNQVFFSVFYPLSRSWIIWKSWNCLCDFPQPRL